MSSEDGTTRKPEIEIGEIPQPEYAIELSDDMGERHPWIGMRAYAADGKIYDFLWWRNIKVEGDTVEECKHRLASLLTRLTIETGADAAIGLPIDVSESDPKKRHIQTITENGAYGIYVDAKKRRGFSFYVQVGGIRSEEVLRGIHPAEFERIYQGAIAVLPRLGSHDALEDESKVEK